MRPIAHTGIHPVTILTRFRPLALARYKCWSAMENSSSYEAGRWKVTPPTLTESGFVSFPAGNWAFRIVDRIRSAILDASVTAAPGRKTPNSSPPTLPTRSAGPRQSLMLCEMIFRASSPFDARKYR